MVEEITSGKENDVSFQVGLFEGIKRRRSRGLKTTFDLRKKEERKTEVSI